MDEKKKGGDGLLRIDLELDAELLGPVLDVLIHAGGTEAVFDALVLGPLVVLVLVPVLDLQVDGLVLFVVRAGPAHAGQDVEGDLTVRFRVVDLWTLGGQLRGGVVAGLFVLERPGRFAAEEVRFEAGVHDAAVETQAGVEGWTHVADLLQFAPYGARAEGVFVFEQKDGATVWVRGQGRIGGFGGEHAASHRRVGALDFGDVEEACRVADEGSAGEGALGNGLETAFVEGSGAIGNTFAAFNDGFIDGVVLHLLEFAVGREPGVGIVETDDKTQRDEVVSEMIEPSASVCR